MRTLILFITLWGLNDLHAQHPMKIEQELLTQFRKIQYWTSYKDTGTGKLRYDSLVQANTTFRNSLLTFTAASRATISYDFNELEKSGVIIKTSEDRMFRIYSWSTGTPVSFNAIYQYQTDGKVVSGSFSKDDGGAGRWYSKIYSLKTDDKMYYIGLFNEMRSSSEYYQGVKMFCIDDNELNDTVALIKTKKGIRNELGFEFNVPSAANRYDFQKLIYFDEDDDQLHLAVVKEDGIVTRQFITYQFTGKYFEYLKQ